MYSRLNVTWKTKSKFNSLYNVYTKIKCYVTESGTFINEDKTHQYDKVEKQNRHAVYCQFRNVTQGISGCKFKT